MAANGAAKRRILNFSLGFWSHSAAAGGAVRRTEVRGGFHSRGAAECGSSHAGLRLHAGLAWRPVRRFAGVAAGYDRLRLRHEEREPRRASGGASEVGRKPSLHGGSQAGEWLSRPSADRKPTAGAPDGAGD